jgi:putative ABC transport system permease protein
MTGLIQDIRYALRQLRKNLGFTTVVVLTLALGIGANAAIFSVVSGLLLRPLPYRDANQLVRVWSTAPQSQNDVSSYPDFQDWARQNHTFAQMAAYSARSFNLSGGDHPERLTGVSVSQEFFKLLGINPLLGRSFSADEHEAGRNHIVVLSFGLWQSHFGSDRGVLGRTVRLNDDNYTVIGVLPASFDFPREDKSAFVLPLPPDLSRNHGFLSVIGRLKPGSSLAQAQVDLDTIAQQQAQQYKEDRGQGVFLQSLQSSYTNNYRQALLILFGTVVFVLLITCANVANLFLAKASSRQREVAVRASLGAPRGRLIRQFLTESLMAALAGGGLGLLLATFGVSALTRLISRSFAVAGTETISTDFWVLAFVLAISILTGLVTGLAPAFFASRADLNETLKEGSRGLGSGSGHKRFRSALVVSEVALALMLLSGSGVLIKSFFLLTRVDAGLQPHNVLAVDFSLHSAKYSHTASRAAVFEEILDRVRKLPGIESAAVVADVPLTQNEDSLGFSIEGAPQLSGQRNVARFNVVGPGYFNTLGIPISAGRDFSESDTDGRPMAVLINNAMAREYWANLNPIGRRITTDNKTWYSIVGVVGDVHQMGLRSAAQPEVYVSYLQDPFQWPYLSLLARASSDPLKLFVPIEQAVWSVDKDQPVSNPKALDQIRSNSIAQPRIAALLLGLFAGLALLLAAVGLYGVVSNWVSERTHEIGVRMALGARTAEVFRLVVGRGLTLALIGAVFGLAASALATRVLASFLFNVAPTDPLTFVAASLLLIGVTLLASYIPAQRAAKVDPVVALRYE